MKAVLVLLGLAIGATTATASHYDSGSNSSEISEMRYRGGDYRDDYRDRDDYGRISRRKARRLTKMLYRALLFRDAERGGEMRSKVNTVVRRGLEGLTAVARDIGNSYEFRRNVKYNYSNRQIVTNFYNELLLREPDQGGFRYWVRDMRRGASAADVAVGFVNSDEFKDNNNLW